MTTVTTENATSGEKILKDSVETKNANVKKDEYENKERAIKTSGKYQEDIN